MPLSLIKGETCPVLAARASSRRDAFALVLTGKIVFVSALLARSAGVEVIRVSEVTSLAVCGNPMETLMLASLN